MDSRVRGAPLSSRRPTFPGGGVAGTNIAIMHLKMWVCSGTCLLPLFESMKGELSSQNIFAPQGSLS